MSDPAIDFSSLGPEDSTEIHDGITWVWFHTLNGHGHKTAVISLRIDPGSVATVCGAATVSSAVQVRPFGLAWARCLGFLDSNPSIVSVK